jgi:riboflavin kinase
LRLLDVGCGTGALFPFLKHAVQSWNDSNDVYKVQLRITGVDLSPNMIAEAQNKYRDWMAPTNDDKDNADVIVEDLISSDILEFTPPVSGGDDSSSINSWFFDVIVINACFGNFFDPRAVLEHLEALLVRPSSGSESFTTDDDGDDADAGAGTGKGTTGARICVTHPLGAAFVRKLHEECADTVPHVLPTLREMQSSLLLGLPLVLTGWEDRMPSATGSDPIYYAEIQSVRYRALPNVMRLRGTVASGFGRGGKKLGFPTANLGPTQVFELALEAVDTGVYFGGALVEKGDDGVQPSAGRYTEPPTIYKAVVNVGYSPTFQEQNPAKIVEAHLIEKDASTDRNLGDFYNQTLRLELIGYLRPELKFPTFPDLIAQITSDRGDASRALDQVPYSWFRDDPFLRLGSGSWIGCTGGDADASWELVPLESTLDTLAMRFGEE